MGIPKEGYRDKDQCSLWKNKNWTPDNGKHRLDLDLWLTTATLEVLLEHARNDGVGGTDVTGAIFTNDKGGPVLRGPVGSGAAFRAKRGSGGSPPASTSHQSEELPF